MNMQGQFSAKWSLQRRFVWQTAYAVVAALLIGGICVDLVDDICDEDIVDQQLDFIAATLSTQMGHSGTFQVASDMRFTGEKKLVRKQRDLLYQVWRRDGTLLRQSDGLLTSKPLVNLGQVGYSTIQQNGRTYRAYAAPSVDGGVIYQVAEQVDSHDVVRSALLLTYFVALLFPLFLTWRLSQVLMRRTLDFFRTLAEKVAKRDPQDARPVSMGRTPMEVAHMLESVNGLVQRASHVISLEQRFTSVAVHELRAPLAGIRAQAQLAQHAQTTQELKETLVSVIQGVDHAARVFDQLLDLTRMEGLASERATQFKTVCMQAVCRQALTDLQYQMQRKHIHLIDNTKPHGFEGIFYAAYLCVRNLIANAVLYTPDHGTVALNVFLEDKHVVLQVDDSGPGIPPQDRPRAFERYSRLQQTGSEGIGLGLSIVQQAVHLHNGRIELLDSPHGGLRAQVTWPKYLPQAVAVNC